ncbi:RNA polymerase sigma factor [Mycolicibacterium vinylchloridicum]|uniref:RNA polymerase sigma factor n=1 Tax=Mycolicibacterium vinylchloridicum TaxID=2736928 RepID=UPI0015CDA181|nr:sigma-70 family RNA polymerase sigma factor [Mycolicibacterium vinylchloridicum]
MVASDDDRRPRPDLRLVPDAHYPDWEAVYDDNVTWMYRMIFGRVGNQADAEDLTSEVFVAAMRPLRLTASIPEVRAYLRATARTVLAAHWRATLGTEITTVEDLPATDFGPAAPSTAPQRVAALLDALPDNYRRVLELRFLQGCSVRETASTLGVSVANAKVLQHRALRLAAQISERALP